VLPAPKFNVPTPALVTLIVPLPFTTTPFRLAVMVTPPFVVVPSALENPAP